MPTKINSTLCIEKKSDNEVISTKRKSTKKSEEILTILPKTKLKTTSTIKGTINKNHSIVEKGNKKKETGLRVKKTERLEEVLKPIEANEITKEPSEIVKEIPLGQLHSPKFYPFIIKGDDAMDRLVDSIKKYGVREPGVARKSKDGTGFELLVGNRRKRACELAGLSTMPVIIRELTDDDAIITMVDSNLEHREELLFSEKAWAYKIKMEALSHRGIKGDKPSAEMLADQTGDSRNQIFRLIRLTELVIELLDKVDAKQLAFNPGVELSYLSKDEQLFVASEMEANDIKPSLSQAVRLKKLKQSNELTKEMIRNILSEEKPDTRPINKESSRYSKFFPLEYTPKQMHEIISGLLQKWQKAQRSKDVKKVENTTMLDNK